MTFYRAPAAVGALALLFGSFWTPSAQRPAVEPSSPSAVARGEYLVTQVAMCVQCHSPRDERGAIIESEKFHGAAIPVNNPPWNSNWAVRAPNIAGLPGFTDQQVIALLTTGDATGRPAPMRPMPPFRMSTDDATAVVAYLRTR